jgi:hypothetical protein
LKEDEFFMAAMIREFVGITPESFILKGKRKLVESK